MLTEKVFSTDTVSINYAEGPPSGTSLVMLHGVTTWWQTFLPVLPGLCLRYHTYALDLRGHGQSTWTPGAYAVSNDITDVSAFLHDRVGEPAVLLGWSLGAIVALLTAAASPESVRAVVLVDPPLAVLTDDDASQDEYYVRFRALREIMTINGTPKEKRALLAELQPAMDAVNLRLRLKQLNHCDPEVLTSIIDKQKFKEYQLETVLPKVTSPLLLMQADPTLGGALDDQSVQTATALLDDCAHVYLPGVGHGIHG